MVCLHKNKFDEIFGELDSTENPRSFEKYPTLPVRDELVNTSTNKSYGIDSADIAVTDL